MQQEIQEKIFVALNDLTEKGAQQAQDIEVQDIGCGNSHERVKASMKEEERKEIIYKCPKFLYIKYTPPTLNKAATPAIRKNWACAALYGIQIALANMTRELIYDVASSITQSILNNLHKSMELPCRVPQLVESNIKPLVKNKQLDALLAAKKPPTRSKKTKRSLFFLCLQNPLAQYKQ
ncbi:hypothetical protein BB561_005437 [Smittium simulii]|uniref:Uncharacterized protein n=1 Tax=Smittium simulii TaxID=133385 RepID=A0A2T9YAB9_9FUNG|nr:hypothetical protein BB561_005437 [Smittium simulii]